MADSLSMALTELLRKAEAEPDLATLREGVRVLTQALMELEVAQHLGAERYQRSPERQGERNGYRDRNLDTRVGTLELRVPRVRDGSFFPGLLEPRKRAERALVATVREAYVQGVSTRRVDDLVKALGMDGISKSRVSRLCEELDAEVERFRTRKFEGTYPYIWVDATFLKVRQEHRVVNMAVVIAVGLNAATGQREVLGVDVGPSEDGAFWLGFLRGRRLELPVDPAVQWSPSRQYLLLYRQSRMPTAAGNDRGYPAYARGRPAHQWRRTGIGAILDVSACRPTRSRAGNAADGLRNLRQYVQTLITIPNDRLLDVIDRKTSMELAFMEVDDVPLAQLTAAKCAAG